MAIINWERLLTQANIEYKFQGKNIYCQCPLCGNADGGMHMGISLAGNAWGCWRNKDHRGRSPVRLLMALLKVSYTTARDMAGLDEQYVDPDGYEAIKHTLFNSKEDKTEDRGTEHHVDSGLEFLPDFMEISEKRLRTAKFYQYLVGRGFHAAHINDLCRDYKLRAAVAGKYKDRVIVPYIMERRIVSWTGRAVGATSLRYLDLSKEESITPPKEMLYNHNCTRRGGKVLLVVEGPFDALKLDFYGKRSDVRTVALSTNSITDEQTYLLEEVSVNFKKVLMVMDNGNSVGVVDSMKLKERLAQIHNIGFTQVPVEFKDGGDMPQKAVENFVKGLI